MGGMASIWERACDCDGDGNSWFAVREAMEVMVGSRDVWEVRRACWSGTGGDCGVGGYSKRVSRMMLNCECD